MFTKKYIYLKYVLKLIRDDKFEEFKSIDLNKIKNNRRNNKYVYNKYCYFLEDFGEYACSWSFLEVYKEFTCYAYALFNKKHLFIEFLKPKIECFNIMFKFTDNFLYNDLKYFKGEDFLNDVNIDSLIMSCFKTQMSTLKHFIKDVNYGNSHDKDISFLDICKTVEDVEYVLDRGFNYSNKDIIKLMFKFNDIETIRKLFEERLKFKIEDAIDIKEDLISSQNYEILSSLENFDDFLNLNKKHMIFFSENEVIDQIISQL